MAGSPFPRARAWPLLCALLLAGWGACEGPVTVVCTVQGGKGRVVMDVHPDWAPAGAARFLALVDDGYYDGTALFRWSMCPGPA